MTISPSRARGLIDWDTGAVLAVTDQGISWLLADSTVDVTPGFSWGPIAIGGGSIAIAGSEWLQCRGSDAEPRTIPAPAQTTYRLAVAGTAVAAVSRRGQLTCWRSFDADPQSVTLDLEPDGLAVDPSRARIVVWGWGHSGSAAMAVLDWTTDSLAVVDPAAPWPAADSGVAIGLPGGVIGVGGPDSITLLSANGARIGDADLPGLERVAGSASGLAWIRTVEEQVLAGIGLLPNADIAELHILAERPIRVADPFPEFAPVPPGDMLLVAGTGPHQLAVHRLSGTGWAEPVRIALPRTASP